MQVLVRAAFSLLMASAKVCVLFEAALGLARQAWQTVSSGQFSAGMRVSLVNYGPAIFWLGVPPQLAVDVPIS